MIHLLRLVDGEGRRRQSRGHRGALHPRSQPHPLRPLDAGSPVHSHGFSGQHRGQPPHHLHRRGNWCLRRWLGGNQRRRPERREICHPRPLRLRSVIIHRRLW